METSSSDRCCVCLTSVFVTSVSHVRGLYKAHKAVRVCVCVCVQVLQALQGKYGDLYRQDNVVLSGTHTHCGPGGYFQYTLFMITGGYIKAAIKPLVNGIVKVCVF